MTQVLYREFLMELSLIPIVRIDTEPLEQMLNDNLKRTLDVINYRRNKLSEEDCNKWGGLLATGFFMGFEDDIRLACFCVCMEASTIRQKAEIEKACQLYTEDMPVFQRFKNLYREVRKGELINYEAINRTSDSYVFTVEKKNGYGVIDRRLPVIILDWLDTSYSPNKRFIRINPYVGSLEKPLGHITEAVLNYPDPQWWADLRIYNGKEKGSSYQLLDDPNDADNYWDFRVKGIRKLEFHVRRNNEKDGCPYLSMMMEELEYHQNFSDSQESFLIGRMIHLDTQAAIGDEFIKAKVLHIDLSYNYYFGDKAEKRLQQDLSLKGRVVDADHHIHLLRVEDIDLSELFPMAFSFFKSKTMVYEWCHYQFMGAEFNAEHRIIQ